MWMRSWLTEVEHSEANEVEKKTYFCMSQFYCYIRYINNAERIQAKNRNTQCAANTFSTASEKAK